MYKALNNETPAYLSSKFINRMDRKQTGDTASTYRILFQKELQLQWSGIVEQLAGTSSDRHPH